MPMKKKKERKLKKNLFAGFYFLLVLISPQWDNAKNQDSLPYQKRDSVEIVLPPKLYCISGKPLNIYFDNLIIGDYKDYLWDTTCEVGIQQNERWHFDSGREGEIPLEISIHDKYGRILDAQKCIILIKPDNPMPEVNVNCLFIGHSIIASGITTRELIHLFSKEKMSLTLIGTKGKEPNFHEGRSGWKLGNYYSRKDSPFVFDKSFNFKRYMEVNKYSRLDYLFICLGITDFFNIRTDQLVEKKISVMINQMTEILNNIHRYDKRIKIGIMISIPPAYNQDGFGAFQFSHTGQTRWRYKRNILMWAKKLIHVFKNKEKDNIYLIPVNVNLDTLHNMPGKMVPANSRTDKMIFRQDDPVHPAKEGHFQIADVIFSFIKYMELKNADE
jgi:lysophospholipase L1-like esterase